MDIRLLACVNFFLKEISFAKSINSITHTTSSLTIIIVNNQKLKKKKSEYLIWLETKYFYWNFEMLSLRFNLSIATFF